MDEIDGPNYSYDPRFCCDFEEWYDDRKNCRLYQISFLQEQDMEIFEDDMFHSFLFEHLDAKRLDEKAERDRLEAERIAKEAAEEAERIANMKVVRPATWKWVVDGISLVVATVDVLGLINEQSWMWVLRDIDVRTHSADGITTNQELF